MAPELNTAAFDRYTSEHFGAGVTAAVAGIPWWLTVAGSVGWERIEDRLKDHIPSVFPYAAHDSLLNSTTDTAAVVAGWAAGRLALEEPDGRDRVALDAAVGATLGAVAVRVTSLLGYMVSPAVTRQIRRWDHVGAGVGGGIADYLANRRYTPDRHPALLAGQAFLTGLGAGAAGPLGAAILAYLGAAAAQRIEQGAALGVRLGP